MQGCYNNRLVMNDAVFPHWIYCSDGTETQCFWYLRETDKGKDFRLVDARGASNKRAFDQQALANGLADVIGETVDPENLPITDVKLIFAKESMSLQVFSV